MLAYRYTVGLRSILLAIAGEGESERYLLIRERGRVMSKIKQHLEDLSQKSYSWQDMANLNHTTQVAIFGWCACEEQEQFPYANCPREGESV